MLYLEPSKITTYVAEWLRRWTSVQTFVGSTPIIDDIFVMPNSYPSDGSFNSHRTTIIIDFFLHTLPSTIVLKLEYGLLYQFYAEITTFSIKKCSVRHPSTTS